MEANTFSAITIDYDIIFVGPLGTVVANLLSKSSQKPTKGLVIAAVKQINVPSLLPSENPMVQVENIYPKDFDVDTG